VDVFGFGGMAIIVAAKGGVAPIVDMFGWVLRGARRAKQKPSIEPTVVVARHSQTSAPDIAVPSAHCDAGLIDISPQIFRQ